MHFVKKVPTSEEEKEANAKKRIAKLRIYSATRNSIFKKRLQGELDEQLLTLTGNMLLSNPEIATFWNIRREVINLILDAQGTADKATDTVNTKRKELLANELVFTEKCLQKNSKSYGAWFHRGWAIKQLGEQEISKDLETTERFLGIDGRNFHCWDYRRLIVALGKVDPKNEMKFSTRLINGNFSNYSSWHYRSVLLPKICAGYNETVKINKNCLATELDMVSNAFFMDPEDQSAWIYTEWLLKLQQGQFLKDYVRAAKPTVISAYFLSNTSGCVVMDRPVTAEFFLDIFKSAASKNHLKFVPVSEYKRAKSSTVFMFESDDVIEVPLIFPEPEGSMCSKTMLNSAETGDYFNQALLLELYGNKSNYTLDSEHRKAVESVAEKCVCLMQENSKDQNVADSLNRWPLFIYTLCLMFLDSGKHFDKILANFKEMETKCDPKRCVMYSDMCAAFCVKNYFSRLDDFGHTVLEKLMINMNSDSSCTIPLRNINLRNLNSLVPLSGLITSLDLSDNKITDLRTLVYFRLLTNLILNNNSIRSINPLCCLGRLKVLSVSENPIHQYTDVHEVVENVMLEKLIICGTPLAAEQAAWVLLRRKCDEIRPEIKLIRHWM